MAARKIRISDMVMYTNTFSTGQINYPQNFYQDFRTSLARGHIMATGWGEKIRSAAELFNGVMDGTFAMHDMLSRTPNKTYIAM